MYPFCIWLGGRNCLDFARILRFIFYIKRVYLESAENKFIASRWRLAMGFISAGESMEDIPR